MKSNALQTGLLDSHTTDDLVKGLREAVEDWKLVQPNVTIPVTTDNARNIVNAVTAAGLGPQIGCFVHTITLAVQKGMAVQQVSHLLAKMRKIVTFFFYMVLFLFYMVLSMHSRKCVRYSCTRYI